MPVCIPRVAQLLMQLVREYAAWRGVVWRGVVCQSMPHTITQLPRSLYIFSFIYTVLY